MVGQRLAYQMKLIIAGSRLITDYAITRQAILASGLWDRYGRSIEVVSGLAEGPDKHGLIFAKKAGLKEHKAPADWDNITAPGAVIKYRKKDGKPFNVLAGHWRNQEMAEIADEALIVWDGKSTGSLDMLHRMLAMDKPVHLYPLRIGTDAYDALIDKGVHIILPEIA
jgi:predicted Rossmann fold nucleotide-binding protein DprA/Smf involved in DNA uptake